MEKDKEEQRYSLLLLSAVLSMLSSLSAPSVTPPSLQALPWKSIPMEWLSESLDNIQAFILYLKLSLADLTKSKVQRTRWHLLVVYSESNQQWPEFTTILAKILKTNKSPDTDKLTETFPSTFQHVLIKISSFPGPSLGTTLHSLFNLLLKKGATQSLWDLGPWQCTKNVSATTELSYPQLDIYNFRLSRTYTFVIQELLSLLTRFDQAEIDTVIIASWRKPSGTQLQPAFQSCSGIWILCACLSKAPTTPIIPVREHIQTALWPAEPSRQKSERVSAQITVSWCSFITWSLILHE